MIVDSSAVVAIISGEPERAALSEALEHAPRLAMSTATWFECSIVVDSRANPMAGRHFDRLIEQLGVQLVPVSGDQARIARAAYRDFGKGSASPARLNFGDCFSYALAHVTGEPLLYKGDDFSFTDITSAI